jgi:hypothetical protein
MLPDFPVLKEKFQAALSRYVRERAKVHGVLVPSLSRSRIFEGRTNTIIRSSGQAESTSMMQAGAELQIPLDEIPTLGLEDLLRELDTMAKSLAGQQENHLITTLEETTEKAGQVIDGKGQPLSPDLLFRVLEALQIEFNADGTPELPTLVVHPDQLGAARSISAEFNANRDLARRFEEIIAKKREEWRAREADRHLVG